MSDRNEFTIRAFDPDRDQEAAYRCLVSSFHHNSWPLIDHAEPRFMKDSMLTTARMSQFVFVAEKNGEARGLLAGFFPREGMTGVKAIALEVGFALKVLLRRYDMTAFARATYWRQLLGEISFHVRSPRTPAEVILLGSQEGYRGGIGRALMDAWVAEVRARGYLKTTVCTDSTVSWEFYERYGFRRVREFPIKMFFHSLPGVDAFGYIYSLDLQVA